MTADHPTPAAGDAVESLRGLTACYCDPAWTDRKLHAPQCLEEYREDVDALAAELARRDAALADLTRQRDEAQRLADYWKKRTEAAWERGDEQGFDRLSEFVDLRAQLERQAPVIEAAREFVDFIGTVTMSLPPGTMRPLTRLAVAVDALGPVDPEASE